VSWLDAETGYFDVWILPLEGERRRYPFVRSRFRESQAMFSPDGRWMAYCSAESGRREIYLTPFPGPGRKWQISNEGGDWPDWRPDGKEIFYEAADGTVTAVTVNSRGDSLVVGTPRSLFPLEPHTGHFPFSPAGHTRFSPMPDGQRFLTVEPVGGPASRPLTVLVNWLAGRPTDR
jgi:hypothetical protein